jgi:hypothetical protein
VLGDGMRDGADVPRRGKGRQPAPRRAATAGQASELRADATPTHGQRCGREALQDQRAAPARRAPRALEDVKKVLTDGKESHAGCTMCQAPIDMRHRGFT